LREPGSAALTMCVTRGLVNRLAGLALLLVIAEACAGRAAQTPNRLEEIRRLVRDNLHFDFHCMCRAVDDRTIKAAKTRLSEEDIPALVTLLEDEEDVVSFAATQLLVTFAPSSVLALEEAVKLGSPRQAARAREALIRVRVNESQRK
jgi:hypothetical protein